MNGENTVEEEGRKTSMRSVLRNRNYRIMWIGRAANMLGGQFSMIAMPWLVLQLTGSPLAMGTVMAVSGIPRAAFMLVGGVLTDRFNPRLIMIVNSFIFAFGLGLESALVLTEVIQLWMLYVFALFAGILDAFYFPAVASLIPQLVSKRDLPSANALVQGTMQACMTFGPALAGGMIALLSGVEGPAAGTGEATSNMHGIGIAFAINASTFVISAIFLIMLRIPKREPEDGEEEKQPGMWTSIRQGMSFVWKDRSMAALFVLFGCANFFTAGPMAIGIPVLAHLRFEEGAAAFGIIMSGMGVGMFLGTVLVATLPNLPPKHFGAFVIGVMTVQGLCLVNLAFAQSTFVAAATTFVMGSGTGYMSIMIMTWFQRRTPLPMLGRTMSLLMFVMSGLQPFSLALAGVFVELNATATFVTAGVCMALVALMLGRRVSIREMGIR